MKKTFFQRIAETRDRFVEAVGGVSRQSAQARAAESYADGYKDATDDEPPQGDLRSYGYRSSTNGPREFKIDYRRALNRAWQLWQENPVADRALEIKRDYIIDNSVAPQTKDESLQEILTAFWSENRMSRRASEFTLQLFLFGAQCLTLHTRKTDGRVRIGYIDPEQIERVVPHPENAIELWAVVVQERTALDPWDQGTPVQVYRIARHDDDVIVDNGAASSVKPAKYPGLLVTAEQANLEPWESEMLRAFGLNTYTGTCLYERVNAVSNQTLGSSDLLQESDWLNMQDETLFALADREQRAGYFSWDCSIEGNKEDIERRAREISRNPPKNGAVNVHNKAETWELKTPDLKQQGSIETARELLTFVLGGLGLPRHWYGYGDETNRATAQAQGDPTWRSLKHDQGIVQEFLTTLCEFARDQAIIAGAWRPAESQSGIINMPMPAMTTRDITQLTGAMSAVSLALQTAVDAGWITDATAGQAWGLLMQELGVDYDVVAEMQAAADATAETPTVTGSWFRGQPEILPGGSDADA